MCAFGKLPRLVTLMSGAPKNRSPAIHPGPYLQQMRTALEVTDDRLVLGEGYRQWLETPAAALPVYLATATGPDPFLVSAPTRWVQLAECLAVGAVERELMRAAYDWFLS